MLSLTLFIQSVLKFECVWNYFWLTRFASIIRSNQKVVVSFHTDDRFWKADIARGWNCRRVYFDAAVDQFAFFFSFWKCARKHQLKLVLFLLHIVVLPHIPSAGWNIVPLALLLLVEVSSLERKICCSLFRTDNKILQVAKMISTREHLTYFSSK